MRSGLADFWGATALSRLVTTPVPTAIARPVSALRSSLSCYRHSSGGAVHAGNSELLALTLCVFVESCTHAAQANTCPFKETMTLCVITITLRAFTPHPLPRSDFTFRKLILAREQKRTRKQLKSNSVHNVMRPQNIKMTGNIPS